MLEFKNFKVENKENSSTCIKFNFIDKELSEENLEIITPKLEEYEIYLEYDCKGDFKVKYKKNAIIEMSITFPSRKVPEDKKDLESFVNKHIMDFDEYYYKLNNFDNLFEENIPENI